MSGPLRAEGPLQRLAREATYAVVFRDTQDATQSWERAQEETAFLGYRLGQRLRVEWTHAGGFTILGASP